MLWDTAGTYTNGLKMIFFYFSFPAHTILFSPLWFSREERSEASLARLLSVKFLFKLKLIQIIWIITGQEEFDAITKAYYRGAQACVLAFSTTDRMSFEAVKEWKMKVKSTKIKCSLNTSVPLDRSRALTLINNALFFFAHALHKKLRYSFTYAYFFFNFGRFQVIYHTMQFSERFSNLWCSLNVSHLSDFMFSPFLLRYQ